MTMRSIRSQLVALAALAALAALTALTAITAACTPPTPTAAATTDAPPLATAIAPAIAPADDPSPRVSSSIDRKRDVRYLDDVEGFALRDDVVGLRLASFRYANEPESAPRHIGFLIEDQPGFPAIDPRTKTVDLYSYVSMTVAALQVQQAEIQALHEELHALGGARSLAECRMPRPRADRPARR